MRAPAVAVGAGVAALFAACAFGAAAIESELPALPASDPLSRFLGSSKEAIGDTLFLKADAYYHGGVAEHVEETAAELAREGHIEDDSTQARDWVDAVNRRVRGTDHVHLTRDEQKELLPFFALAVRLDPHNIEALLTTAYWLDENFGRTDRAISTLKQGFRDNPTSGPLVFQLGRLYHKTKDFEKSTEAFREALQKSGLEPYERREAFYRLGESLEAAGDRSGALGAYRQALALYGPSETTALKGSIAARIASLESVG